MPPGAAAWGALCFTVPIIVGRLTRNRDGLPPSYHGDASTRAEDFRVRTEFGADMWTLVLQAGFAAVTVTPVGYPAALALTGWRDPPAPLLARPEMNATTEALAAELVSLRASTSWRMTAGLRALVRLLRGAR